MPAPARGGPTPAWTLILVPPTPRGSTKRIGVRMRTLRITAMAVLMLLAPTLVLTWAWMDARASTALRLADRLTAQERLVTVLADSLDAYRRAALARGATDSTTAAMMMPLPGRVTSWFSRSRLHPILRIRRPHKGIDVAAASGTQIVAPATAVVASVRRQFGFGLTVELVHAGGVVTRYAHLRRALVKAGDAVATGQAIATVGSSGLATAPHLHFEVLVKGKAVDPMRFLVATRGGP